MSASLWAQNNDFSDEFEISDPAFEINDPGTTVGPADGFDEINISDPVSELPSYDNAENSDDFEEPPAAPDNEEWADDFEEAPAPADIQSPAQQKNVLIREKNQPTAPFNPEDKTVEVRSSENIYWPYKQRQGRWGFLFSAGAELISFPGLYSQFDDATPFEDVFGSQGVNLFAVELGPKLNTSLGSFSLTFGYGLLDIADGLEGEEATLLISRYSATLTYFLDMLWKEPFFVPYVGGGIWQAEYAETFELFPQQTKRYTTDIGYHWRIGALIGLDWIEPRTALRSRRSVGLQATFLNLYAASTYMSESNPDPDLENEMDFGASLILEF